MQKYKGEEEKEVDPAEARSTDEALSRASGSSFGGESCPLGSLQGAEEGDSRSEEEGTRRGGAP